MYQERLGSVDRPIHGGNSIQELPFRDAAGPCGGNSVFPTTAARESISPLEELTNAYHPYDEESGYDYDRVFVDGEGHDQQDGKVHEKYGITEEGCVVIVRPDQYINWIGSLEDLDEIDGFFDWRFDQTVIKRQGQTSS